MKTKVIAILTWLGLSVSGGLGQSTVNFTAAPGQPDIYYQGAPLADGNQVRIGYFNAGFAINSYLNDLSSLATGWHTYGSTSIRTLVPGEPGRFAASQSLMTEQLASSFENQKIYLWIFKTTDNGAPAVDYSNVSGYGLYSSTDPAWVFPGYLYPANITEIHSGQVNQAFYGSYDADHLTLTPVPEPTHVAGMILALGLLMMASRSREQF